MSALLWKLGAALAVGIVGLTMTNYGVERSALVDAAAAADPTAPGTPMRVIVTLFVGVLAINVAVFWAITVWSRFVRSSPDTRQLPVPLLVSVVAISGALGVTGFAQHYSYVRTLTPPPVDPSWGYLSYMTMCGLFFFVALVVVGVRWMPGKRPADA